MELGKALNVWMSVSYRISISNGDIMIREFFLGFIKIHILHHASEAPIYGAEIIKEIRRHGYKVSPGLIYPTLHSLEKRGYLKSKRRVVQGKVRRYYEITEEGLKMLEESKRRIRELVDEVLG